MDEKIKSVIDGIQKISNIKLTDELMEPFNKFFGFVKTSVAKNPKYLDPEITFNKWYHRYVNGIYLDVRQALVGTYYHLNNVRQLELNIFDYVERLDVEDIFNNANLAIGSTNIADFEYQAYVLSYRRCLDYLARGIASSLCQDQNSFNALKNFLEKKKEQKLLEVYNYYRPEFDFVISTQDKKTTRDLIAHYQYTQAWTLNLSNKGLSFAGGPEQLHRTESNSKEIILLSTVLDARFDILCNCIRDFIQVLIDTD